MQRPTNFGTLKIKILFRLKKDKIVAVENTYLCIFSFPYKTNPCLNNNLIKTNKDLKRGN